SFVACVDRGALWRKKAKEWAPSREMRSWLFFFGRVWLVPSIRATQAAVSGNLTVLFMAAVISIQGTRNDKTKTRTKKDAGGAQALCNLYAVFKRSAASYLNRRSDPRVQGRM